MDIYTKEFTGSGSSWSIPKPDSYDPQVGDTVVIWIGVRGRNSGLNLPSDYTSSGVVTVGSSPVFGRGVFLSKVLDSTWVNPTVSSISPGDSNAFNAVVIVINGDVDIQVNKSTSSSSGSVNSPNITLTDSNTIYYFHSDQSTTSPSVSGATSINYFSITASQTLSTIYATEVNTATGCSFNSSANRRLLGTLAIYENPSSDLLVEGTVSVVSTSQKDDTLASTGLELINNETLFESSLNGNFSNIFSSALLSLGDISSESQVLHNSLSFILSELNSSKKLDIIFNLVGVSEVPFDGLIYTDMDISHISSAILQSTIPYQIATFNQFLINADNRVLTSHQVTLEGQVSYQDLNSIGSEIVGNSSLGSVHKTSFLVYNEGISSVSVDSKIRCSFRVFLESGEVLTLYAFVNNFVEPYYVTTFQNTPFTEFSINPIYLDNNYALD